ncbi:hypothetical protein ACA910_010644 [Epithemia clementina (nom. ined.)]
MMNGHGGSGKTILVLYKIVNSDGDGEDNLFNAFPMPRDPKGPTLASVKQHCRALHGLSHLGPDGYHWRVCMEDKPAPGEESSSRASMSWWDVQDESAVLPVKEASAYHLGKFFSPPKEDTSDSATKAARGMFKAMAGAVSGNDGIDHRTMVSVVAFKLLDLVKMHDDFKLKHPGQVGGTEPQQAGRRGSNFRSPTSYPAQTPAPARPPSAGVTQPQSSYAPPPRQAPAPRSAPTHSAPTPARSIPAQGNLMDFSPSGGRKNIVHMTSSPASFDSAPSNPLETRAEKLKREYAEKKSSSELEWDPIEQRMVQKGSMTNGSMSAPTGAPKAKIVGTKLDAASTIGKSAAVADAMNKRIRDMEESQNKALLEMRERDGKIAREKAEEDEARKRLEPRIKAWSEEHGKRKQLRALLGTLHTILWADSGWKPVSIGDILDDGKVKKVYFKASRIVHPDKVVGLSAENRFLAKRIFDSLTQAKVDFDNGKK